MVGMGLVALAAAAPAAAFDRTKYVGTWSGTWKNVTFKVPGTFGGTLSSPDGQSLTVDYVISSLFNCGPTPGSRTLVSGVDFTAKGLNFQAQNAAWGTATVTSRTTKRVEKIKAAGTAPCNLGISSWSLRATLTAKKLAGKMKIRFAQGTPKRATAIFKATKQAAPCSRSPGTGSAVSPGASRPSPSRWRSRSCSSS